MRDRSVSVAQMRQDHHSGLADHLLRPATGGHLPSPTTAWSWGAPPSTPILAQAGGPDHLAVVMPVRHGVPPLANLLLHGTELLLQELPHVGQVTAIDPVVVDGDGVFLQGSGHGYPSRAHSTFPCSHQEGILLSPNRCQQGSRSWGWTTGVPSGQEASRAR